MQELLQQENGILSPSGHPGHRRAGNRILPSRHLRTVSYHWRPGTINPLKIEMKKGLMRIPTIFATLALLAVAALNASAQTPAQPGTTGPANSVDTDRIIRAFTAKEAEFLS